MNLLLLSLAGSVKDTFLLNKKSIWFYLFLDDNYGKHVRIKFQFAQNHVILKSQIALDTHEFQLITS